MPKDTNEDLQSDTEKTIFVSGLSYESTEKDIRKFFEKCGEIDKIKLPKYQDSDRNIGYCHITFETQEEAAKGLKLDGERLGGRYLKINWSKGAKSYKSSKKILI